MRLAAIQIKLYFTMGIFHKKLVVTKKKYPSGIEYQFRQCGLIDFLKIVFPWNHFVLLISLRPSDAYMHQYLRSPLVKIMACCLFGAKPSSEPVLAYW